MARQPTISVPAQELYMAWRWEEIRIGFLTKHGRHKEADQARKYAELYRIRLRKECGLDVQGSTTPASQDS